MNPPSSQLWSQMIQIYAIVTVVLFIKHFILLLYSADMSHHPEEDKLLGMSDAVPADIKRRARVFANHLENVPMHQLVFLLTFVVQNLVNMSGYGDDGTKALCVLYVAYAVFRVGFTLCYIAGLQPYRTVLFLLSQMTVFVTMGILLKGAWTVDVSKLNFGG